MNTRPKIKLELSTTDKIVEITGWFLLLAIWGLMIMTYRGLPEIIPIHYNASGEADGFGDKVNILIPTLVITVVFVAMTILNKFPHIFNYLIKITEENAFEQYRIATRMMRYLKLIIVIIFGTIIFKTVQNSYEGDSGGLGAWLSPFIFVMVSFPLVYFVIKSLKIKK